jgi:hypothetical protein
MFAMICTRIDLAYPVAKLSRFMTKPTEQHLSAAKRVMRYIAQSSKLALTYRGEEGLKLTGYSDADWASDASDSKSVQCYIFTLAGGAISWKSTKQRIVATSSTESEYISLAACGLEAVYLRGLMEELYHDPGTIDIQTDNNGSVTIAKEAKHHERTKHIRVKYHKIRELEDDGTVAVNWIPREENPADLGTKALPRDVFEKWIKVVGMHQLTC